MCSSQICVSKNVISVQKLEGAKPTTDRRTVFRLILPEVLAGRLKPYSVKIPSSNVAKQWDTADVVCASDVDLQTDKGILEQVRAQKTAFLDSAEGGSNTLALTQSHSIHKFLDMSSLLMRVHFMIYNYTIGVGKLTSSSRQRLSENFKIDGRVSLDSRASLLKFMLLDSCQELCNGADLQEVS